jgi:hypothetical protein
LVGADANMIDAYNIHHFLKTIDVSFEAREEVPDADRTSGLGDGPRMVARDLSAG